MNVTAEAVTEPLPAIPAQSRGPQVREDAEGFKEDMEALFAEPLTEAAEAAEDTDVPVTLKQAVDQGIVSVTLSALRKEANDKARGKEFPASVGKDAKTRGKLYRPSELKRWERNRPKAGQTADQED
uniref:hypothetical protein n=1 Tax=Streptomyces sp. 44414 TaxID=364103 RepID=UPI00156381FC|nr:hypothetical protein [Streptomyces sp. 44414]